METAVRPKSEIQKRNKLPLDSKELRRFTHWIANTPRSVTCLNASLRALSMLVCSSLLEHSQCTYNQSIKPVCPTLLLKVFQHFELKDLLLSQLWQKNGKSGKPSPRQKFITSVSNFSFSRFAKPASPANHM